MAVGTSNFGELLWPGIKELYGERYNTWEKIYTKVFDVIKSDMAFEKFQGVTGFGLAGVKDQGKAVPYADPLLGFQTIIEPVVYALGATVTVEMYEDEQYNFIDQIPKLLADTTKQTVETVAHTVFNNAFDTNYAGADGTSLCSISHPLVDGSGTYANRPTVAADLTQTSLENAAIAISNFVDDRNKKINLKGKTLLVSTADQFVAEKITGTQYKVDSADNTINPMYGKYKVVVSPFLTDPDAWFLLTDAPQGLIFTQRREPKLERQNEFDTMNLKFIVHTRFGVGFVNPRIVYGSPGTG